MPGRVSLAAAVIAVILSLIARPADTSPAATGAPFRDCDAICPEMVAMPDEPIAIGRSPMTFAEYDACVAAGFCFRVYPRDQGKGRGRRPVVDVSGEQASAYAQWLSYKTGHYYRLPTRAELEQATRADDAAGGLRQIVADSPLPPTVRSFERGFRVVRVNGQDAAAAGPPWDGRTPLIYLGSCCGHLPYDLPKDAAAFIARRTMCSHWAGEEPYDEARARALAAMARRDRCDRIEADEKALLRRYAGRRPVIDSIVMSRDWLGVADFH